MEEFINNVIQSQATGMGYKFIKLCGFHVPQIGTYTFGSDSFVLCSAIHNLAVALYSLDEDEESLVSFINASAQNTLGSLCFDAKYALRLVRERDRPRACVVMLCVLGLYEDAVELALSMDLDLAKSVARTPELTDEGLKRKLWLAIAKHVIQKEDPVVDQEGHISQAVGLLDDAGVQAPDHFPSPSGMSNIVEIN